jgi:iron complex outermembrane recepter protein
MTLDGIFLARHPIFLAASPSRLAHVLLATAFSGSVFAQTQAPTSEPVPRGASEGVGTATRQTAKEPQTLESVIVTGSRRREPLREVPLSVNSVSSEEMTKAGAQRLSDYVETLTGVNVDGGGRGLQQLSIRGITLGGDINPPTSTYLGDVPFGGSSQFGAKLSFDMGMLDLDHIEVYRGPQGTLYGANSLGGVIKYVFNDPDTQQFSGNASVGASTTQHGGTNATANMSLNVPLKTDTAAVRLAAVRSRDAGYVDSTGTFSRSGVDQTDSTAFRIAGLFTPNRQMSVRLTGMAQDLKRQGGDYTDYTIDGQPVHGYNEHAGVVAEPFRQRVQLYSAEVEYELPGVRFNGIVSHQSSRNSYTSDVSAIYAPLFESVVPGLTSVDIGSNVDTRKDTLELRLTSPKARPFEWLAGVFANRERNDVRQAVATGVGAASGPDLQTVRIPTSFEELAVFGDLTYYATESFSVTVGARESRNRQKFDQSYGGLLAPAIPTVPSTTSDHSATYLLTGRYSLTPKSNVYVRIASGYNPGGINAALLDPASGATLTENPSYRSNSLVSSELGYKADLFGDQLSVQAALYHLDWRDIQLFHPTASGNEVVNGGRAKVDGAELSLSLRPTSNFTLDSSFSYIDGKLTEDVPDLQARSGDRLPISAKFSASVRARYEFNVAGMPSYVAATYRYLGARNTGFVGSVNPANYVLPAYSLIGIQAGVDVRVASISLYVRNLANTHGQRSAVTGYVPFGQPVQVSLEQPRTIGFTVAVPF